MDGANGPYPYSTSQQAPLCLTVGTEGIADARAADVTASGLALPAPISALAPGSVANMTCIRPAATSSAAGAVPLWGTCIEAAGIAAMEMLERDGVPAIGAVAMPGSAPVVRLMRYPDGPRLGLDGIVASLERGIDRVAQVVHDAPAARRRLPGD